MKTFIPKLWFQLEEIFCLSLRFAMIPFFVREVYARHKVTIINYHDPSPELFAKHMEFYVRHYSIISMDQLINSLTGDDWWTLPAKSMVITLDDGHSGNARLFSIIRHYRIPVVLYATSGLINTRRRFWFRIPGLEGCNLTFLKSIDDDARRKILKKDYGHTDDRKYEDRTVLSRNEVTEFLEIGGVLGSHTLTHPILTMCKEKTVRFELRESKKVLERDYGISIKHFAYPGGSWDGQIATMVEHAGFMSARTIDPGWGTTKSKPFALPNFGISDNARINKAVVQASGVWEMLKRLFSILFRV